jgi:hypothetical protein
MKYNSINSKMSILFGKSGLYGIMSYHLNKLGSSGFCVLAHKARQWKICTSLLIFSRQTRSWILSHQTIKATSIQSA